MNRKYYFNNMWWGWVTGGYMLYMSWDYDFKYRLLFWCISLCGMVLYPVAKWYCLLFIRVLFSYYLFR